MKMVLRIGDLLVAELLQGYPQSIWIKNYHSPPYLDEVQYLGCVSQSLTSKKLATGKIMSDELKKAIVDFSRDVLPGVDDESLETPGDGRIVARALLSGRDQDGRIFAIGDHTDAYSSHGTSTTILFNYKTGATEVAEFLQQHPILE